MSHQPDLPSRTRATLSPVSRDAGLLRIRSLTKGAAAVSAFGAIAIGVVLAQPAQSQAASTLTNGANTQGAQRPAATPDPPAGQSNQQPLAPPPQQPQAAAPQAPPPAAVSGGS